jgi:hypothetical protein
MYDSAGVSIILISCCRTSGSLVFGKALRLRNKPAPSRAVKASR